MIKINKKILSIPPYISTTWNHVSSIRMKDTQLVIYLIEGETIYIPGLPQEIIDQVFDAHFSYLDQDVTTQTSHQGTGFELPIRLGINSLDEMASSMQHNPTQKNLPDVPKEILDKICAIAKIVSPEDIQSIPKPEPHCNCLHCQISRTIHQQLGHGNQELEEEGEVKAEELNFRQWEIMQTGDKLFSVINKLDSREKYSVYLGHPLGCTCGKAGCEHIIAVLKS